MATCIVFYPHACCPDRLILGIRKEVRDNLVCLLDLRKNPKPDIGLYRHVLIGIPFWKDKIPGAISRFCHENRDILAMKKVGFFLCSPAPLEQILTAMETVIPPRILKQAKGIHYFPVDEPKPPSWRDYFTIKREQGAAHLIRELYDHSHIRQFTRNILMLVY